MEPRTKIMPGDNPEQRPVEHMLTKVIEWQQSDRSTPEPVVQCPVCHDEISVKGLSPLNPVDAPSSTGVDTGQANGTPVEAPSPAGAVDSWPWLDKVFSCGFALDCGHMLCQPCGLQIFTREHRRECVLCRRPSIHAECGDLIMTPIMNCKSLYGLDGKHEHGADAGPDLGGPEWWRACVYTSLRFKFGGF